LNLVVRPVAAEDIQEAFRWYELRRPGLGVEFLDTIRLTFETIAENPCRYPVSHRDTRRANVRRFPFGIFYRVVGSIVIVVACFHGKRAPRRWRKRR